MADALRDWLAGGISVIGADGEWTSTESPIEAMLLRAFYLLADSHRVENNPANPLAITISCQQEIGKFRVDFLFTRYDLKCVVECDGHDFHERTKEQAAKDRSRDRWLTAQGYSVLRFTGSEIWANPFACADQLLDFLLAQDAEMPDGR